MSMVSEAMKEQFAHKGFIIFEQLFSDAEMDALRERVDALDEQSERQLQEHGQDGIRIPNQINFTVHLHEKDEAINRFIGDKRFVDITTALIAPDMRLYWNQSVYKRPEAKRDFPWHQDTGYVPTEPQVYLTCWLALDDATIENGCVWVKPGSHLQGFVAHENTPVGKQCYFGEDPGIPVELKKGSMVAFSSLLFHRSTPNLSNTTRKGYVIQYSKVGSYNPETGQEFNNGPIIALDGKAVMNV